MVHQEQKMTSDQKAYRGRLVAILGHVKAELTLQGLLMVAEVGSALKKARPRAK